MPHQTPQLKPITDHFLHAEWPAPANVKTLITTRNGGVSSGAYHSLNLGLHVGDIEEQVLQNREQVRRLVGKEIAYLNQVHGIAVANAADAIHTLHDADAVVSFDNQTACAVMTADCLPVLLCDVSGSVVGAAHCGWRSLAGGVLHQTITKMAVPPSTILAYLGPAIGPQSFEVGQDVFDAFCATLPEAKQAFTAKNHQKYLADIYTLARLILQHEGVRQIYGGGFCTVQQSEHFFSYRRDKQTGRMASIIWLE